MPSDSEGDRKLVNQRIAEAQHWWSSQAPKVIASSKAGRRQSRSSSPATVAIDLARRFLLEKVA